MPYSSALPHSLLMQCDRMAQHGTSDTIVAETLSPEHSENI